MTNKQAFNLGKAVSHWFEFQVLCGREWLLSEKFIAQPIGEFIHSFHKEGRETETDHPEFKNEKPGRNKQVDYALFNREGKLKAVIETKWIGANSAGYRQGILNDILRLESVKGGVDCYLLIAGRTGDFENNFRNLEIRAKQRGGKRVKFFDKILPLDNEKETVEVESCAEELRKFFKKFSEDYKIGLPKSFKIERVFHSDQRSDVQLFIWKVSRSQNRTLFDPAIKWPSVNVSDDE